MTNYGLILDDTRTIDESLQISCLSIPCFGLHDWKLAKDCDEFKALIELFGLPAFVSFDHDLGLDKAKTLESGLIVANWSEETGLTAAKWLVEYCFEQSLPFPEYRVHSANPVGKENILGYIRSAIRSGFIRERI